MKTFILGICLIWILSPLPVHAEINSLSQAINDKAYLLKAMDIQPKKVHRQFIESQQLFTGNLAKLKSFSQSSNNAMPLKLAIKVIEIQWHSYRKLLIEPTNKINSGEILALSDRTLAACEALVEQLEQSAQRQSARWVNLSGRQRMLSQRIAKFYSAISLSGKTELYQQGLQQAVNEFDDALQALIHSPDNTHFLNHKLKKVATQWNFSKQGFKSLNKGESTPLVIFMTTETILNQMNDITALYEAIDNKRKHSSTG